jgi:GAF domain-containing protein
VTTPAHKARKLKSTATAGLRASRASWQGDKLAAAQASYEEALEQQAATAEILGIIAETPQNTTAVFNAITRAGKRLIPDCRVALILAKDGQLHYASYAGLTAAHAARVGKLYPCPLDAETVAGAAVVRKCVVQVADLTKAARQFPRSASMGGRTESRAILGMPLISGGAAIGAIVLTRQRAGSFSKKHVSLAKSFADQAVIAIENARLFNETREALERQTATAEILRVISTSPTDAQPVFEAIATNAMRLMNGFSAAVTRRVGEAAHLAAFTSTNKSGDEALRKLFPIPLSENHRFHAKVLLTRAPVHVPDIENDSPVGARAIGRARGYRSALVVPMMRGGEAIGGISVTRREPGAFSDHDIELLKTFADQAVIAIENARLFNELQSTNATLRVALEQQTATADILKVISRSATDVQPVFETIAANARRLLNGSSAGVVIIEGEIANLRAIATSADGADYEVARKAYPMSLAELARVRAQFSNVLESRQPAAMADAELETSDEVLAFTRSAGIRSNAVVPLTREGKAIGLIVVNRGYPHETSPDEFRLLQTFADQAVIAIENARLFDETKEALDQQTAISEVLRVISNSPADVRPVFDAVAQRAAGICEADDVRIFVQDGDVMRIVAGLGDLAVAPDATVPIRGSIMGRVLADRAPLQVDMATAREDEFPFAARMYRERNHRIVFVAPLLREGRPLGAIIMRRTEGRLFTDKQIKLLQTFADQAAIAIENVRLFDETREALERQTATADILKVIASSPSDVQPVFETIARSAHKLCNARYAVVTRRIDDMLHLVAHTATAGVTHLEKLFPVRLTGQGATGKAVLAARPAWISDVETDPDYSEAFRAGARERGYRSQLTVPMLRNGEAIGAITVTRPQPGEFPRQEIDLLQTFADQAVIAIENVRLFNETKEALERQTATADILRVIASSPSEVQPVFDAIVERAVRLCGAQFGRIYQYDGRTVHMVASQNLVVAGLDQVRRVFPRPADDQTVVGTVLLAGKARVIHDVDSDAGVPALSREMMSALATKSQVTTPMMRSGEAIGAITLGWSERNAFDDKKVVLSARSRTRRSSRSRTYGSSTSCRRATKTLVSRSSSRPRQARFSRSSAGPPSTCNRCSRSSCRMPAGCAKRTAASSSGRISRGNTVRSHLRRPGECRSARHARCSSARRSPLIALRQRDAPSSTARLSIFRM